MNLWFTEDHTDDVRFSIKIKEQLYTGKSYYQQIDVFDSYEFGRFLTLDGYLMLTEKDEFIGIKNVYLLIVAFPCVKLFLDFY